MTAAVVVFLVFYVRGLFDAKQSERLGADAGEDRLGSPGTQRDPEKQPTEECDEQGKDRADDREHLAFP